MMLMSGKKKGKERKERNGKIGKKEERKEERIGKKEKGRNKG